MSHGILRNDQIIFQINSVREKLKRTKGKKQRNDFNSGKIKFEESKLAAKNYQKIRVNELKLRKLLNEGR